MDWLKIRFAQPGRNAREGLQVDPPAAWLAWRVLLLCLPLVFTIGTQAAAELLTPEERTFLQAHGPLRYAPDPAFPPFEFFRQNQLAGITPEILAAMARNLDTEIKPVRYATWTEVLAGIKRGEADLLGTLTKTPEREEFLLYSQAYLSVPYVLFVKNQRTVSGFKDLVKRRVGVVKDYGAHGWLKGKHPEVALVPVATTREGLLMLATGNLDAMLETLPVGGYVMAENSLTNLRILPEVLFTEPQYLAVRKNEPRLLAILQKGLDSVTPEERLRIFENWMGKNALQPTGQLPAWVGRVVAVLLAILVLIAFWNISLRRVVARRTRALRESETQFRRFLESMPVATAWANAAGQVEFVNQKFVQLFGYAMSDIRTLKDWFLKAYPNEQYRRELKMRWQDLSATARQQNRETEPIEVEVTCRDGAHKWVEMAGRFVEDKVMAAFNDLTSRKRAEALLREGEANLATAQRMAHLGSFESGLENQENLLHNPLKWSDEVFRIFGYEPGQVEPSNDLFFQAVPEPDRNRILAAVREAIRDRKPYQIEHRIRWPNGAERTVIEQAEIVFDQATGLPRKLVGTVQDITERKQTEETRLRLEAQLRQAQKMEAVGQLAGGVAHDFNNILTVIMGNANLLVDDPGLTPESLQLTKEIAAAAGRGANLTRQLLTFSRQQVIQVKPVNLNNILANLHTMLSRLLGEHIALQCQYGSDLPAIEGDTGMIEQVIMNLAVNSRDAMPKGGLLTLSTSSVRVDQECAGDNTEARPGLFVVLKVADTGCGMDAATMNRLFEPFFTTKEAGKGTGLGSAMVYGIIKQHRGWINVTSEPGQGTVFMVYLPASSEAETVPRAAPASTRQAGGQETILVVEDEESVRHFVRACLTRYGYRVLEAADGLEALRLWNSHQDQIDLVLTDIVMPHGMSGKDLAEKLAAAKPSVKIIYTSGYSRDILGSEAFPTTENSYLAKPYNPATLAATVRKRLDQP